MTVTAYPLTWPHGWRRQPPNYRKTGRFGRAELIEPLLLKQIDEALK